MTAMRRILALPSFLLVYAACRPGPPAAPNLFTLPPAPRIDVAVGVRDPDGVMIYYDVMNRPRGATPDAYLDGQHSGISHPSGLEIAADRLYVANRAANTITVYPDFAHLVDGQVPDTVLDLKASLVEAPTDVQVFEGDLYVGQDVDRVLVFQDVSSLASGDPPDVVLDSLGSGIDNGADLVASNMGLFVANREGHTVTVYNEPSTLTSFAPPSRVLRLPTSGGFGPTAVAVEDRTLYVAVQRANEVLAFANPDRPSGAEEPLWTLGPPSGVSRPSGLAFTGHSVAVGNAGGGAGLLVFRGPSPADVVAARADAGAPIVEVGSVASAGEVLFCTSAATDSLYGFRFPGQLTAASRPDITLSDPRMDHPLVLRAVVGPDTAAPRAPERAPDRVHP
jgi:hypothetical protein